MEGKIYEVTPVQIWTRYVEVVKSDMNAAMDLPTIRELRDIERLSREKQIELFYKVLEYESTRGNKAQMFEQILNELKTEKKHGIDYLVLREKEQIREVFKNAQLTKRYVLTIQTTYKKNYYLVYSNTDLTLLDHEQLKEIIKKVHEKYKLLVKRHLSVREFAITHKNISLVLEKFKKDELMILTHLTLVSLNKILDVKERRQKRTPSYTITKNLKFFFENLFM